MSYIQYMSKYICCICILCFWLNAVLLQFSVPRLCSCKRGLSKYCFLPTPSAGSVVGRGIASEPKSGQLRVGPTFRSPLLGPALWKVKQFRRDSPSERQLLMVVYPILLPESHFCCFLEDPSLHVHLTLHAASLGWVVHWTPVVTTSITNTS